MGRSINCKVHYWIIFLFFIPITPALDIIEANLNYNSSYEANHNIIEKWNRKMTPEITTTHSKTYIKDAWMQISSIMPSVLYNNTLLTTENPEIITHYNHRIQIPEDEDCGKTYKLLNHQANNVVENSKTLITSTYNINIDLELTNHEIRRYCNEDSCIERCEFVNKENINEQLELRSYKNITTHKDQNSSFLITKDNYYHGFNKYFYDVIPDNNFLQLRATTINEINTNVLNPKLFTTANITYWDHFYKYKTTLNQTQIVPQKTKTNSKFNLLSIPILYILWRILK